jgi:hypothetical protein
MASQPTLAPVQGDYVDNRPAEEQPGTSEHLGESPYQGAPYPEEPAAPAAPKTSKKSNSDS